MIKLTAALTAENSCQLAEVVHTKQLTSTGSAQSAEHILIEKKMAECLSDTDSIVEVIEPEAEFFFPAVNKLFF